MIVVASLSAAARRAPSAAGDAGVGAENPESAIVCVAKVVVSLVYGAGDAIANETKVSSEDSIEERMVK